MNTAQLCSLWVAAGGVNMWDVAVKKNQFSGISRSLIHAGGYFPRPYPLWSEQVYFRMGAYHRKVKMVKKFLDPRNIMNPGKLALA